jgi:hypothetical protein
VAAAAAGAGAQAYLQSHPSVGPASGALHQQASWQQQQLYQARMSGTPSHAGRSRHGHKLTTQEKDVLLMLTAFCKLASREVPGGSASSDSVLAQGKLLALEMLAKVGNAGLLLTLVVLLRGICCMGLGCSWMLLDARRCAYATWSPCPRHCCRFHRCCCC